MKFIPTNGKIVVKEIKQEKTTAGGIVLSNNALIDRVAKGVVISVSKKQTQNGTYLSPNVDEGNTVAWLKGNGYTFKDENGDEIILLEQEEIMGKFIQ